MTLPMPALTVRQPFADAIVHGHPTHGPKTIENRSKPIPAKHLGKVVFIHAGKDPHPLGEDVDWEARPDVRGAVIGIATLTGCHLETDGCCTPWGMTGYWHWELRNASAIARPVTVTGQLGLWTPPNDVQGDVQVQFWEPATYPMGATS